MEILEYIMKTPENTNPNILKEMLQNLQESSDDRYLVAELEVMERGSKGNGATGAGYKLDYSYDELMQAFNNEKTVLIYDSPDHLAYEPEVSDGEIYFNQLVIKPDNTILNVTLE